MKFDSKFLNIVHDEDIRVIRENCQRVLCREPVLCVGAVGVGAQVTSAR